MSYLTLLKTIHSGHYLAFAKAPETLKNGDTELFTLIDCKHFGVASQYLTPSLFKKPRQTFHPPPETFKGKLLNWEPNSLTYVKLDPEDEVILTPQLTGCTFCMLRHKKTGELFACHLNYVKDTESQDLFLAPSPANKFRLNPYLGDEDPKGPQEDKSKPLTGQPLDPKKYQMSEEEEIMMYTKIPLNKAEEELYGNAFPEQGDTIYVKHHELGYQEKIYGGFGLPSGELAGCIDTEKMMAALHTQFPEDSYEELFMVCKEDYEELVHEHKSLISIVAVKNEKHEWSCFLSASGPEKSIKKKLSPPIPTIDSSFLNEVKLGKGFGKHPK